MKKIMIALTMLASIVTYADNYKIVPLTPNASDVAVYTNTTISTLAPVIIYSEINGTGTTNVVAVTYDPVDSVTGSATVTNSTDNGRSYRIGTFTTVAAAEVPIVFNTPTDTDNVANVIVRPGDILTLTGDGGIADTNTYYRIVFKKE